MKESLLKLSKLKLISTILVMGLFFCAYTFAEGETKDLEVVGEAIKNVISFLSRGWIILAILAGKLMTNDFVYASFMNMDTFLRKMWNIMKNFANFTLGFMVLISILKGLFSGRTSESTIGGPMKTIKGALLAGVLIQASWFLIGAAIDISTIAVSAVGAFPAQLISDNVSYQEIMRKELEQIRCEIVVSDPNAVGDKTTKVPVKDPTCEPNADITVEEQRKMTNKFLDFVLPNQDTMGGPLLFMGMSIFKFQDMAINKSIKVGDWKFIFESGALNIIIIVMFSLAMLLLFILNVFRVLILWILIPFSPFIVLFGAMGEMSKSPLDGKGPKRLSERFSVGKMMELIFKPVIFIAYISIMLIFVLGMWGLLEPTKNLGDTQNIDQVSITYNTQDSSTLSVPELIKTTISGLQTTVGTLIVYFFTIFLMWQLIKAAAEGGPAFAKTMIEGIGTAIGELPSNLPIPMTGGYSINTLKTLKDKINTKNGINIMTGKFGGDDGRALLDKRLGEKNGRKISYDTEFNTILAKNENMQEKSVTRGKKANEIGTTMKGMDITTSDRDKQIGSFLAKIKTSVKVANDSNYILPALLEKQLTKDYLNIKENAQAFYYLVTGEKTDTLAISNYTELTDALKKRYKGS